MPRKPKTPAKPETKGAMKKRLIAEDKEFKALMRSRGRKLDKHGRLTTTNPANDIPMNLFWEAVDLDRMEDALEESGKANALRLIEFMNRTGATNMSKAARECGISLQELNEMYKKHSLALGMIGVSEHLPKVMLDTAVDAESTFDVCDRCDGTGEVTRTKVVNDEAVTIDEACPKCKGAREVRVSGDAKARDQVFKMAGLADTGPMVAIQTNLNIGDSLDDTLATAQQLLIKQPIIDVEVVEETDEPKG